MDNKNEPKFDPDEVQIQKSYSAMNSRIEKFIRRKRAESNDRNTRVYCSAVSSSDSSRTCSTIAAKRQKGSECFVKTVKVVNPTGPLCNGGIDPASQNSYKLSNEENSYGLKSDVHERISNVEKCLKIEELNSVNCSVYTKIKGIEDRLMQIEQKMISKMLKKYDIERMLAEKVRRHQSSVSGLRLENKEPDTDIIVIEDDDEDESSISGLLPKIYEKSDAKDNILVKEHDDKSSSSHLLSAKTDKSDNKDNILTREEYDDNSSESDLIPLKIEEDNTEDSICTKQDGKYSETLLFYKKSKYSADEIKKLINSIKNNHDINKT